MRFLIAGLGSIGRRHLRNLLALGEEDIVLLRTGKSSLPDDELHRFPVESDIELALSRFRPDAVVVCNPTSLHLDVAIRSAQAGCHLLIEKPISSSLARMEDLESSVKSGGGRVLVGYQFRFHPLLRALRNAVHAGLLGAPRWAIAHWGSYLPDWHGWEDYRVSYAARADLGGGVLLTLCHPLDYLLWIFGELRCDASRIQQLGALQIDVDDFADVWFTGAAGLSVGLHLNYYERPTQHWLAIGGDAGSVRLDFEQGTLEGTHLDGIDRSAPHGFERNDMFLGEMHHFLEVCHGLAEPLCGLDGGVAALRLAMSAHALSPRAGIVGPTHS